jgi:hypothetical protein
MGQPTDAVTSVYRYYDQYDVLIYVGITGRGSSRNREHNLDKDWWPFVVRQDVDHFENRDLAHAHEVRLIQQFRPPFNSQHNPEARAMRSAYLDFAGGRPRVANPLELLRLTGGRIPLVTLGTGDDGQSTVLRTTLDHADVAVRLLHVPEVKVSRTNGRRVGHVQQIQVRGPFAAIDLLAKRDTKFEGAYAKFKHLPTKGPVNFVLRSIITPA